MKTKTKRMICILLSNVFGITALFVLAKIITFMNFECIWYTRYGIYCATCGMTRAISALSKLELYQAFRYNELLFFFLVYGLYWDVATSIHYWKYGAIKVNLKHIVAIAIIVSGFMFLRNIPAFSFLAPTII